MSANAYDWIDTGFGGFYCEKARTYLSKGGGEWIVYSSRHGIEDEPTGETDLGKAKQAALQMVFGRLTDELSMIELLLTEDA